LIEAQRCLIQRCLICHGPRLLQVRMTF
jgi:hypothetical protein